MHDNRAVDVRHCGKGKTDGRARRRRGEGIPDPHRLVGGLESRRTVDRQLHRLDRRCHAAIVAIIPLGWVDPDSMGWEIGWVCYGWAERDTCGEDCLRSRVCLTTSCRVGAVRGGSEGESGVARWIVQVEGIVEGSATSRDWSVSAGSEAEHRRQDEVREQACALCGV